MSRKHYIQVAKIIADQIEFTRQFNNGKIEQHRIAATIQIARDLADMFQRDNAQFDRERFLTACNVQA
tara:strand:+ start:395 stop:598 length:204 start_codon:yes stop_codon:yes gene_type:complete